MKKLKWLMFFMIAALIFPVTVKADESSLALESKSYVLMELSSGEVVAEKNADEAMPPASITKIMTLLLIYEAVRDGKISREDTVTVSSHAASMGGSQVFLEEGEEQTVADLTKCIAIASANDAAVAMAEFIGGSEEAFVKMMNDRAKELKMDNTHFVNACGLDSDGHLSSARDIAIMSRQLLLNFPEITEYTTTWMDTIKHKTRRGESEFGLTNTNKLIKWYKGATGLKTGSTDGAKYCLSGSAKRDGVEFVAVVMASPDYKTRFREVMSLLDYGFANYTVSKGVPKDEKIGEISVQKGVKDNASLVSREDFSVVTKKGGDEMEYTYEIMPFVKAPVLKGQKTGEIVYKIDGKEVGRVDLVADEDIKRMNFADMFIDLLRKCV